MASKIIPFLLAAFLFISSLVVAREVAQPQPSNSIDASKHGEKMKKGALKDNAQYGYGGYPGYSGYPGYADDPDFGGYPGGYPGGYGYRDGYPRYRGGYPYPGYRGRFPGYSGYGGGYPGYEGGYPGYGGGYPGGGYPAGVQPQNEPRN